MTRFQSLNPSIPQSPDPKLFWHFTCGILTAADDPAVWSNQAQIWVIKNKIVVPGNTAGFTYFSDVLGGPLHDSQQANTLAQDLLEARSDGLRVRAMGHSNGCKLLLEALLQHPELVIEELHLVAAAVEHDCQKSGLNDAVGRGQIASKVALYVSTADEVLGIGNGLGYGDLGLHGPTNASIGLQGLMRVIQADPPCRHSDWVGVNFEATMRMVTGGAG